jgi:hypothetical protein
MHRRTLLFTFVASLFSTTLHAEVWQLITDDEFEREKLAPKEAQPRIAAQLDGPVITVERPDETKPIKSPVSIFVSFRPQGNATIDLSSLRFFYGFLRIDITKKIVEHAQLTASGLSASNAQVPSGHHRVTIQIADSMHRVGSRDIEFTVV